MTLVLENVSKSYNDGQRTLTIISELSYTFPEEGALAIVGRSGVGKSTLLHLLGGLDTPSSGKILYGQTNIAQLTEEELTTWRGHHVGFIFQFHHLLPEFTALENVAMPLLIRGVQEKAALQKAQQVLDKVGLSHRSQHRQGELSGGEQQRVAIARAIVGSPRVILADEPTGNLDVETARTVQDLLLQVQRELRGLLVVVTHSRELAQSMDRSLEMLPGGGLQSL